MFSFDMHGVGPGNFIAPFYETLNSTNVTWGRLDQQVFLPAFVSGTARDAGNTAYTDVLRPGLLLGRITATGSTKNELVQWDPTATNGSQFIWGVLLGAQKVTLMGNNQDRMLGYILTRGNVKANGLVIPSLTTDGIVGTTLEWAVRRAMNQAFCFDDMPLGYVPDSVIQASTATATTLLENQAGTRFVSNAAGAATYTLPATPKQGLEYTFFNAVDQNLIVTGASANQVIAFNNATATSVALSTAAQRIGGGFRVVGNGTKWMVTPLTYTGQTVTVA